MPRGAGQDVVEPSAISATSRDPSGRRWLWLLAGAYVLQVAVRMVLGLPNAVPTAIPDELGYLFGARLLNGGPGTDLSGWPLYQIGYPILLTPAYWIARDPIAIYRAVIVINALLSALLMPLTYVAARRLDLTRWRSFAVAQVTALLPASVFFSWYALTDAVLPVAVLGWLLLIHTWLTSRRYGWAAALATVYLAATHTRGLIALAVFVVLVGIVYVRRWAPRRATIAAAIALLAGAGASLAANAWVQTELYPGGTFALGEMVAERATDIAGWVRTLSGGLGQIWYLVVSTWGIGGVGLVAAVFVLRRGDRTTRIMAAVVLATTLGIAFATTAALPDEQRIANYVYGRYLACLAPVFFLAGAAAILRARRAFELVAGSVLVMLFSGIAVGAYARERLSTLRFVQFDFPETSFLTWDWQRFRMLYATAIVIALLVLFVIVARRAAAVAGVLVAVLSIGADVSAAAKIAHPTSDVHRSAAEIRNLHPDDEVVMDLRIPRYVQLRQAFQIPTSVVVADLFRDAPPGDPTLVIVGLPADFRAETSWPDGRSLGWRPVQVSRGGLGDWVAWRRRPR